MIAITRRIPILFLSVFCLGCSTSSDTSSAGGDVFGGIYDAVSANGSPLPVLVSNNGGCTTTALRAAVTPRAGGRFTATYTYRKQCGAVVNDINGAIGGRYTLNGSELIFAADSGLGKHSVNPFLVNATVSGTTVLAEKPVFLVDTVKVTLRRR